MYVRRKRDEFNGREWRLTRLHGPRETAYIEKDLITLLGIDRPSDRLKAQSSSSQSWFLPQRPSAPSVAPWSRPGNSLSGGIVISVVADHSAARAPGLVSLFHHGRLECEIRYLAASKVIMKFSRCSDALSEPHRNAEPPAAAMPTCLHATHQREQCGQLSLCC
ncbi:hypothetical protein EDB80DRAFT_63139 [Ilyonectria destructans]|nr:hypothetical protein EDB80DRAFT_63139 [Ilyonectria destructans]